MASELAVEPVSEKMNPTPGMFPIAQAPTPFRRRSNCVPGGSDEVDRLKEPQSESVEAVLCMRCGVHPTNHRKALQQRSLCCNRCPDHGPWCTMHTARQCGSHKDEASTSRKQAAPPVEKTVKAQRERRSSVGKRDVVEAALRQVELEYNKKIEMERREHEKRKRDEETELAENEKRLRKRHSTVRSKARTPKKKRGKIDDDETPTGHETPTRNRMLGGDETQGQHDTPERIMTPRQIETPTGQTSTPQRRSPVELALRRVEIVYKNKLDMEQKQQEKVNRADENVLASYEKRIQKRQSTTARNAKRKRPIDDDDTPKMENKSASACIEAEMSVNMEAGPAAEVQEVLHGVSCGESVPESLTLKKRGRRRSIQEVLHSLDEVYNVMDAVKSEQECRERDNRFGDDAEEMTEVKSEGMPLSSEEEEEATVGSFTEKVIRFLHEDQAEDPTEATDAATIAHESIVNDTQTVGTPQPPETQAERRRRGRAALIRAKLLYIEIVREREQQQKAAKKDPMTSYLGHVAFDDKESPRKIARVGSRLCDDDETPRVKRNKGPSAFRKVVLSSLACDDDETPRMKQARGTSEFRKFACASSLACDDFLTPREKQDKGTSKFSKLACESSHVCDDDETPRVQRDKGTSALTKLMREMLTFTFVRRRDPHS